MTLTRALGSALLGMTATGLAAEGLIRTLQPKPRAQVVRHSESTWLGTLHGVPIWRQRDPLYVLRDRPCRDLVGPEGRVVAMIGDSILYMTGTPDHAPLTPPHPLSAA